MANCNKQQLNITCGTDVVLHDTLIFDGETFDPALSTGITANLVSSLGKRTALEVEVADGGLIIYVPWEERNAGYYGLEVTGTCNSKKWATYADSLIHYTRATEIGAAEVTIESDYYDITQVVGYRYSTSPIKSVTATIDDEVGTPEVHTDYDGKNIHFDFHNLKGEPLTYDDLTPQQKEELRGEQGATGVYDQTTQDFLITLETTTGQSQTKTMTQKAITDEFMKDRIWSEISITIPSPTLASDLRIISRVTLKWESQTSNRSGVRFAITSGKTYKIVGNASYEGRYAWLKNNTNTSDTTPYWCDGCSLETLRAGETKYITAPADANYIYIEKKSTGNFTDPSFFGAVEYTRDVISKDKEQIAMLGGSLYERKILPTTATDVQLRYILYEVGTWKANTSALSGIVVEVEPLATYKITPPSGNYVRYAWLKGNDRTIDATPQYSDGCTTSWGPQGETIYITAPSDAHYLYLHRHGYTADLPIYFGRYIASDNGIDENTLMLVKHATIKAPSNDWLPNFSLLHYSDIHGTQMAAENIKRAAVALDQYIQGVLNTGDVVNATTDGAYGGATFYPNSGLQEVSLFTLGNHDDLISVDSGARKDKAWSHALYFTEEVIESLGITMPTGYDNATSQNYNACYWHKDFATQKVRLIGLDCMHKCDGVVDPENGTITTAGTTGNEQEEWLCARLAETLEGSGNSAEGYTVVIAGHYPLDDYDVVTNGENKAWDDDTHEWVCNQKDTGGRIIDNKTGKVSNWHRYTATQYISLPSMRWANADGHNNIAEIIKYYMEEGMNFAAYVCGHTHNNLFFYPTKYPDILNVCIDMAGNLRDMMYADNGTMGGYIANVISFNTTGKRLNIVRLGVKSDVYLTPINYLCYDYANRKVIQEA